MTPNEQNGPVVLTGEKNDPNALIDRFRIRFSALHLLARAAAEMSTPTNPEAVRNAAPMSLDIACLIYEVWDDLGRLYDDVGRIENRHYAIERLLYPDRD